MRDGDAGEVVVQPAEGAAFVVVQAEALLELAVVVLDTPAELGEVHEPGQWRVGGQVGEPVLDRLVLVLGPLGEQPPLAQHAILVALGVVGGANPNREELASERAAIAFAPPDRVDVFTADGEYEDP